MLPSLDVDEGVKASARGEPKKRGEKEGGTVNGWIEVV
jgi:hypothetical protein